MINAGIKWLSNTFGMKDALKVSEAFNTVFNTVDEDVKIVLKDLSLYCNFNSSSFNKQDPYLTAFNEGARDVLLHILELSNIKTATLIELQKQLQKHNNEN